MRVLLFLALCLSGSCSTRPSPARATAEPTVQDGARIWRSLLAYAARNTGSHNCIVLSMRRTPLDDPRNWPPSPPHAYGKWEMDAYRWDVPLARHLDQAEDAIARAPRPWRRLAVRIDLAATSKVFVAAAAPEDCPHVTISSPVIFRDVAFATVDTQCGRRCGGGHVIVLRRRGADWPIVVNRIYEFS